MPLRRSGFALSSVLGLFELAAPGASSWPKLMAYSISVIQNADYLTPKQKRDILYYNAARFLRLEDATARR